MAVRNIELTTENNLAMMIKRFGIRRHYKKNEFIFRLHESANQIYLLEEGWVKVSKDGGEEQPVTLFLHRAGELFGSEEAIAHISLRERDARCLTNCSIFSIDTHTFLAILQEDSSMLFAITALIAKQHLYIQDCVEALMGKTVSWRLASLLIYFSTKKDDTLLVELPITHEELSFMIGCSRQTVTELLNKWRKQGIIDYQKRLITIFDKNALLSYSPIPS